MLIPEASGDPSARLAVFRISRRFSAPDPACPVPARFETVDPEMMIGTNVYDHRYVEPLIAAATVTCASHRSGCSKASFARVAQSSASELDSTIRADCVQALHTEAFALPKSPSVKIGHSNVMATATLASEC